MKLQFLTENRHLYTISWKLYVTVLWLRTLCEMITPVLRLAFAQTVIRWSHRLLVNSVPDSLEWILSPLEIVVVSWTVFMSFTSCLRANAVFTDRWTSSTDIRCLQSDLIQCANIHSCISSMVKCVVWLPLHAGFRKAVVGIERANFVRNRCVMELWMCIWWWGDQLEVLPHLVHGCMHALPKPSLYTSLTCHFCSESPSLRRDYISTVKPAEIAFLVVLQGRSRETNENEAVFLGRTWKWWQIGAEDG